MKQLILFDGECHFCDASVQFIIKRDPKERFHFASLQSEYAQNILKNYNLPQELNSMVLITQNRVYIKSDAALEISKRLRGAWKLCYIFRFVPRRLRNFFYDMFAKNRYRLFGRKTACAIPSQKVKQRFLY